MIKIPSSYNKLIKKKYIISEKNSKKILDLKYELPQEENLALEESFPLELTTKDEDINLKNKDKYIDKEELKKILSKEIERKVVKDIEDERKKILKIANDQAGRLKEEFKKAGYEEGYNLAYEKGYNKGLEKFNKELEKSKKKAFDLVNQAEIMVKKYLEENEENIINLALDMAESIVNFSLDRDDNGILNMIKPVILEYSKKEKIIISCNEAKYQFLKSKLEDLEKISPNTKFFIFKDNDLGLNDCVVECENQVIDLSIKRQMDSIINTIKYME